MHSRMAWGAQGPFDGTPHNMGPLDGAAVCFVLGCGSSLAAAVGAPVMARCTLLNRECTALAVASSGTVGACV
jgi:hypothetical protein